MFRLSLKDVDKLEFRKNSYIQFDTELYDGNNRVKIITTDSLSVKIKDFDFELLESTATLKENGFSQRFSLSNADTSMNKGKYEAEFYYTRDKKIYHISTIDLFIM